MPSGAIRAKAEQLLGLAGVAINGDRPWDIQVHDERVFARVMAEGSLGLGESYMDGWWDAGQLDEFITRVLRAELDTKVRPWKEALGFAWAHVVNLQRRDRAFQIGRHHYDIGNDLFRRMLDRRMIYSCAYWKDAATLDQAQEAKLDLVCRKLGLKAGMRVLDIGCGWGGTAAFAAERYGASVVGITVSEEQVKLARESCRGLPVEIRLQDYRDLDGTFDRVLSIGMFEHVGQKNYGTFMRVVRRHLADDGLLLLHTIGSNRSVTRNDPWSERYIFPNSMLPSARQIAAAIEGTFVLEDWHSFGADYDTTLMHWHRNVEEHWSELKDRYDERFHRMWTYFLLSSAGGFRARKNQLWQLVLSPHGVAGGYRAPR
ncbi:MAG TPA: cyclopropane fatty acyl phospholipid synthase [Gemmatimonadales bacterium]|nr:cyclopropane fatty acyl phospholipid synthase [Gemmatimonadales bacterium]